MTQEDATVTVDELRAPRTEAGRGLHATMHAGCAAADKPCELSDRLAAIEDAAVRDALSVEGREADREAGIEAIRDADTAVPESGYDHLIEQDARGVSCCVEHAAEAAALTAVPDSRETLA